MATPLPDPADLPPPHEVVEARWDLRRGVRLRSAGRTVRLPRDLFRGEFGARAAAGVRGAIPPDRQVGWPRFCRLAALPALRSECPGRPLRWFEMRGDDPRHLSVLEGTFFAAQTVILGGLAVGNPVLPGWSGVILSGAFAGLIWLGRRNRRRVPPRIGERSLRVRWRTIAGLNLALAAGMVAATAVAAWLDARGVPVGLWLPCLPVGGLGMAVIWAKLTNATNGPFDRMRDAEAVAEWDALHADPQREPTWQAALWATAETRSDPDAPGRPGR